MGSWYLVRADLRRRWASASLLGLLIGLAGALVVTGVSGARRGPVAFDEFLDTFGPADFSAFPVDPGDLDDLEQAVAASPGVEAWSTRSFVVLGVVDDHGRTDGALGGVLPIDGGTGVEWPRFLVGGAPVGPFEFAVNEAVAERLSLVPGDEVSVAVYGADQVDQVGTERQVVPAHGVETFTVTGIGRGPSDLQFQVSGQAGTVYEREGENVLWSPALWDRFGGDLANYGAGVLGRVGPGGDARAIAESLSVADGPFEDRVFTEVGTDAIAVAPIRRVIELQSTALLVATGVLAVVASALALQALSRQLAGLGLGDPVLGALGFDRRSAGMAAGIWGLVVALIAVPVLVGGALIGSLAMPVGVASRADFSEGVMIDVRIVAVALALIVSVLVTGAVLQGRGRLRRRPPRRVQGSPLLQTVVRANGRPAPVVGAALSAGTSREVARVPNRTALLSLSVGIAGTVAAVVFGASLDRLTTDPAAFGWSWDVTVANCSTVACTDEAADRLAGNPDVVAYTGLNESDALVDGKRITTAQFRVGRGWAGGRILDGAPPVGPNDMVLAEATARDLDVDVGDEVDVEIDGGAPVSFRVSGLFVPPAVLSDSLTLSEGAGITTAGLRRATPEVESDLSRRSQYFLVTFDPDVDRDEAMARLREDFAATILEPVRTADIEGVYRLRQLPALLAALVAFLALVTLVHFVVVTARRRRTALASLQALGGGRGLGRGVLAWHAILVVSAGLAIGLPIGVVVGRIGWVVGADALEVPMDPVTPVVALVLVGSAVVVFALALGVASYGLRARSPALALRGD